VRARALRAPVFLISLPPQTGAARPLPHPWQLRCFLFIPQKQNDSLQARIRAARGVYLSTGHRGQNNIPRPTHRTLLSYTAPLKYNVPLPRPQPCSAHCSFACSICRIIYRKDPAKNHSMGPSVISHWTTEAKKYKVSCYRSCAGTSKDKNDI
jgi:hypothetical protein